MPRCQNRGGVYNDEDNQAHMTSVGYSLSIIPFWPKNSCMWANVTVKMASTKVQNSYSLRGRNPIGVATGSEAFDLSVATDDVTDPSLLIWRAVADVTSLPDLLELADPAAKIRDGGLRSNAETQHEVTVVSNNPPSVLEFFWWSNIITFGAIHLLCLCFAPFPKLSRPAEKFGLAMESEVFVIVNECMCSHHRHLSITKTWFDSGWTSTQECFFFFFIFFVG